MGLRIALLLLFLGVGCEERTEIVVSADTDLVLDRIRFEVTGPRGNTQSSAATLSEVPPPVLLGLVHQSGPFEPLDITVIGESAGVEIVRRRVRTGFIEGETHILRMNLLASCVTVTCEDGESCGETGCQSVDVDPAGLPTWTGPPAPLGTDAGPRQCGAASDCNDGVPCTVDDCVSGTCTNEPNDSACSDGVDCTTDICTAELGCRNMPDDAACTDGVMCTVDVCDASAGCTITADDALCDDGTACSADTCDATMDCQHTPDHMMCTVGELCDVTLPGCAPGPTFTEVYAMFRRECGPACHIGGGGPQDGLDMSTQEIAYAELVNIPAESSDCLGAGDRVTPHDAQTSVLWRKLSRVDICGTPMPNMRSMLSAAEIDLVAGWINAGAANN